jgi:phage gp45-like
MHRATPLNSSFRAYSGGGSRSVVHEVDDNKGMQETKANFMAGETRTGIEAPQNYGFTSTCADGDKDSNGKLTMGPEAFMGFNGGNRSFPVCYVMDDRRHRLNNLAKDAAKGASAMYGLKKWGLQQLISHDGMFNSVDNQRRYHTALVQNTNEQQQQQGGGNQAGQASVKALAGDGGGGDQGTQAQQGQQQGSKLGQKTLHQQSSDTFHEINSSFQQMSRGSGSHLMDDSHASAFHGSEAKSCLSDGKHTHIKFKGMQIWVDDDGCWSSKPIQVSPDPCGYGGSAGQGGAGGKPEQDQQQQQSVVGQAGQQAAPRGVDFVTLEAFQGLTERFNELPTMDAFRAVLKRVADLETQVAELNNRLAHA